MQGHPATLRKIQREAAERELRKQGKGLKDYPWPEDNGNHDAAPEFRGSRGNSPTWDPSVGINRVRK